ncbi:phosphatase and actin regulator 1-like, partial [Limulus polyphemus]|uniref:Phosphatase and actin regulator 1-like n=1 Tax=Limulus polyphemus TaxID=6850 RepID=A0ABM1RXQ1_LIMPO
MKITVTAGTGSQLNSNMRTSSLENPTHTGSVPSSEPKPTRLATLTMLFKPWKWKKKKRSDKFDEGSRDLERKISLHSTKEELIERDVLLLDRDVSDDDHIEAISPAGDTFGQISGSSVPMITSCVGGSAVLDHQKIKGPASSLYSRDKNRNSNLPKESVTTLQTFGDGLENIGGGGIGPISLIGMGCSDNIKSPLREGRFRN